MKHIDFLKEVLMSDAEYWIVAKNDYGGDEKDSIMLVSIPQSIKRGMKYEEIKLQDLEKLANASCDMNIFMAPKYPPFQMCIRYSEIYVGFPIKDGVREFMVDALALGTSDIYDYKRLIKEQ